MRRSIFPHFRVHAPMPPGTAIPRSDLRIPMPANTQAPPRQESPPAKPADPVSYRATSGAGVLPNCVGVGGALLGLLMALALFISGVELSILALRWLGALDWIVTR